MARPAPRFASSRDDEAAARDHVGVRGVEIALRCADHAGGDAIAAPLGELARGVAERCRLDRAVALDVPASTRAPSERAVRADARGGAAVTHAK